MDLAERAAGRAVLLHFSFPGRDLVCLVKVHPARAY
jgi:hypothetical protein